ncbi:FecR family protein [Spirosoma fluviale]|uniref:FecR family protein n=1 Tax=Spirosoma fluviale TaxID=1597977 RepID=A0A286G481_9BACT|nr:FecR domain-containing protein [Spirosoma fluviale]SOD90341.1 FecR family protein [Spirosoma fluviale]
MNQLVNKQLIFDSFAGKTTSLQRKLIDEWCEDPRHEELFYEWLEEWEQSHLQYVAEEQNALKNYTNFLTSDRPADVQASDAISIPFPKSTTRHWLLWAVAASITILVGSFIFRQQLLNQTYETAYGQTRVVQLEDGSQVTLNANTTLRVPRFGFGRETRQVWLDGEALFSVTHMANNQRFVVKTDNGADVVVLGTEFTLYARARGTQVVLQRGKVELHYHQAGQSERQITLKPGDLVNLKKNGVARLKPIPQPANYAAWRDHRYVFEETSLREITYMFQENFGISLEISDPETAALTLSGAYPAQSADELLSIIAEALNVQVTRQSDKVLLAPQPI